MNIERKIANKFKEIEEKIRNSFVFIRQDINEMQEKIEKIRSYLKKQEKQTDYARKKDNKLRAEFRKQVDEFSEKMGALSISLSKIKEIEKKVVVKKNLAEIEERVREGFQEELKPIYETIKKIENKINDLEKEK